MGVATTAGASRRRSPQECLIELPFSRWFRKSWWLEWYCTQEKMGSFKDGFWAIDYNGNFVWDGVVTDRFAGFGQSGNKPVVGDWNGDRRDKIGIFTGEIWAFDFNGNYVSDTVVGKWS